MIELNPGQIGIGASWGSSTSLRVNNPTHGGRYCFDLVVTYGGRATVYRDIRDDSTRWRRFVHWISEPFRKADGWGRP